MIRPLPIQEPLNQVEIGRERRGIEWPETVFQRDVGSIPYIYHPVVQPDEQEGKFAAIVNVGKLLDSSLADIAAWMRRDETHDRRVAGQAF